ncbi:MAG: discoidin domain-containing protein [Fuerstiella sp.]|nr:discoidin domain-containing protein [Fuerstiella sp.]
MLERVHQRSTLEQHVLAYTPRTKPNGRVLGYEVSVSNDGRTWSNPVAKGKFRANATVRNEIKFTKPTDRHFIKLAVTNAVSAGSQPIAAIGELDVLTNQ